MDGNTNAKTTESEEYHVKICGVKRSKPETLSFAEMDEITLIPEKMVCPVNNTIPQVRYKYEGERNLTLKKGHPSDSGFDLWLERLIKIEIINNIEVQHFDTGMSFMIPDGFYLKIYPRSSFTTKAVGYMLPNCPAIIDQNYRGKVIIKLWKIRPEAAPLSLPISLFQVIPEVRIPCHMIQIQSSEFETNTDRSTGGFGSTDKK